MASSSSSSRVTKNEETKSTTEPNWLALPRDVTVNILLRLDTIEIVTSACLVCPLWWNIFKDPFMWHTINLNSITDNEMSKHKYPLSQIRKICCYAVKRSCGHLEDINIDRFGIDDLLEYIANCSSHLRCLSLSNCKQHVSDKGLRKVAKKLPLLEKLDLSDNEISKYTLEVIGQCCPLLKSLKFSCLYPMQFSCDEESLAIAKTMPGLRYLDISGRGITIVGLLAILDGCPLLETLDLDFCMHLDLCGSLAKRRLRERCRQQIQNVRLPLQFDFWIDLQKT